MSPRWAVRIDRAHAAAAGRLRLAQGVEVCESGDAVWLRGASIDETLDLRLRQLPGAERFSVLTGDELRPAASRLPSGHLPKGPWKPLRDWLAPELPTAALPGRCETRVPITLVRASQSSPVAPRPGANTSPDAPRPGANTSPDAPRPGANTSPVADRDAGHGVTRRLWEPGILVTTAAEWVAYAAEAPQVRLERWTFAACDDGRVVVRGRPLPPIAGTRWIEREGIAVPAGWTWSPAVDAAILGSLVGVGEGDLALLAADGTWERIAADEFVRATRSAVRRSCLHPRP